jgi:hypothetical protein
MASRPLPRRRPLPGDVNEAGGNPMERVPRNPRMDSADVPRRRDPRKAMGIPRDEARRMAEEARQMREADGDVIININNKEKEYNRGGDVCPPNARSGKIDMRKDKGMVRHTRNNLKK